MKRSWALLLAVLALLTALAGCSQGKTASPEETEKVKIGVLVPWGEADWNAGLAYYARQRCEELSQAGEIEYQLYVSGDASEMAEQADRLRRWGAQGVVYYPYWDGMGKPLQQLLDTGAWVVSIDYGLGLEGASRVTGDHELLGRRSAQYLVDKLGTDGLVIALNDPTAGNLSTLRQKGFEEKMIELAPNMKRETFAVSFDREKARQEFARILSTHPQIDGVFSMDDQVSLGVLDALEEAGRTDVQVITGGGGRQEYLARMGEEADRWLETGLYSPAMAAEAVDNALALARGESVERIKVIAPTVVDRENAAAYLDENCPY